MLDATWVELKHQPVIAIQTWGQGNASYDCPLIFMSTRCFVLPGFAPAGEALLFRQKVPKPVTPRLASWEWTDANLRRADQLAGLTQGPPVYEGVPPMPDGRRRSIELTFQRDHEKERKSHSV